MAANGIALPEQTSSTSPAAALPGARTALVLLLSINLFNYIDRYVLAAVERNIRSEILPDDPDPRYRSGLLSTAFLLSYMLLSPLFGWLGDRMSRWLLISIGVILWSLASGASGFPWPAALGHAYLLLLITRCFVGVGEAAYGPVAPTIISDLYPVKIRGRVLAWFYAAIPVGSALGYALGGIVVEVLEWDWRWAFYLVVPPGIALGLLCLLMPEPPRGQADSAERSNRRLGFRDYGILLHTRSFVFDTLGMTAMTFAMGALAFWMPDYLKERKAPGLGPLDATTSFGAVTVVAGLIATLSGGMLGDRLRARYPGSYFLVSGMAMLIGFPMFLGVLWTPFPYAWGFVFLAIFFLFFNTGPSNTILANVTHPSMRATAFALNIFILHALGDAISPPLVGWISDRAKGHTDSPFLSEYSGLNAGFLTVSLTILVGGVLWLWGARYLEEDTRLAPTRLRDSGSDGA